MSCATRSIKSKKHWCHAASRIGTMQQPALVPCSKQHWCHAASCIGAMHQAALGPCSKQHWGHVASSIGAMQQAALGHATSCIGAKQQAALVPCIIFNYLLTTKQYFLMPPKYRRAVRSIEYISRGVCYANNF